jgi:hypothetical protein
MIRPVTRASRDRRRHERWNRADTPRRLTWRGVAVSLSVAAGFLAFAGFISYIAPVAILQLQREDGGAVRADVTQQVWLVVPRQAGVLRDVERVATDTLQQPTYQAPARPDGTDSRPVTPEQEGVLILSGRNGALKLSVSPIDLDETRRRIDDFLAGSDARLRLWLVSNWKFAVIAQAVVLLPALLILFAVAWDIAKAALTRVKPKPS